MSLITTNQHQSSSSTRARAEKPHAGPHPMGVFATHPDLLQLADQDTVDVPGFVSKLLKLERTKSFFTPLF